MTQLPAMTAISACERNNDEFKCIRFLPEVSLSVPAVAADFSEFFGTTAGRRQEPFSREIKTAAPGSSGSGGKASCLVCNSGVAGN
jgi:hypothetical protein